MTNSKTKGEEMNCSFCYTIQQILMKDWHLIEQQPLVKDIQTPAPHMLQKQAVNQRYTCGSQIIEKAKTHARESCRQQQQQQQQQDFITLIKKLLMH